MKLESPIQKGPAAHPTETADGVSDDLIQATQKLSSQIEIDCLVHNFLHELLDRIDAQYAAFIKVTETVLTVETEAERQPDNRIKLFTFDSQCPMEPEMTDLPGAVVTRVQKDQEYVLLTDNDQPVRRFSLEAPPSTNSQFILCYPIQLDNNLLAVLYMDSPSPVFSEQSLRTVKVLCDQVAISYRNSTIIDRLKQKNATCVGNPAIAGLDQTEEIISQSKLLTNINSEIRTQLSSIIGFSQLLENNNVDDTISQDFLQYIDNIHQSGNQLIEIFNNIMTIATPFPKKIQHEWISPKLVLLGAFHYNKIKATNKRVRYRYFLSPGIPDLILSKRAVLLRLIIDMGTFVIKSTQASRSVCIRLRFANNRIEIAVDNDETDSHFLRSEFRKPDLGSFHCRSGDHPNPESKNLCQLTRALGGFMSIHTSDNLISSVVQIPVEFKNQSKKQNPKSTPHRSLQYPDSNIPRSLKVEILEDLKQLSSFPIFKGGSSRKLIRKIINTYQELDSNVPQILEQIESAVFEGNQQSYDTLIREAIDQYKSQNKIRGERRQTGLSERR